jgi:hypothetical protein
MKHRSVIAFVIVAAALFAAPQLSNDLQSLRSALGARLSGQLMQAFLSLPSGEGAAASVAPLRVETQLASCPKARPAAKSRKNDAASRAAVRTAEPSGDQMAMIVEPPVVSEPWVAALSKGAPAAELPHKVLGDVAMIIPPDSGIDPKGRMRVAANVSGAYRDAVQGRRLAEQVRMSYVETRFEAKRGEWRKVENDLREVEKAFPGSFEFRLDRDGSKPKVLKVKRGTVTCCPLPAPPAPRPTGADAAAAPVPAFVALSALVSE